MINIIDKHNCVGCRACEQVCPKRCIDMRVDPEGFKYPEVNSDLCIDCHLCEKVCPVLNELKSVKPLMVYGCKSTDKDIQLASSSGGCFTQLAKAILQEGGLVFGAIFDEKFIVIHSSTDKLEELDKFRRSKYVQSDTQNSFALVKEALAAGRKVMFCGTPCQIKGLNLFLRESFPNLLTIDFICHGVPSPKVWADYLKVLKQDIGNHMKLISVNFRSKAKGGWHKFALEFKFANTNTTEQKTIAQYPGENVYYQLFFQNLSLRPSCFKCPAKGLKSGSDLTIGDFWGIQDAAPERDDYNGISLVIVNSDKGHSFFNSIEIDKFEVNFETAVKSNPSIFHSVSEPVKRRKFFAGQGPFTKRRLDKFSGMDLYGRTRRHIIEMILKITKR